MTGSDFLEYPFVLQTPRRSVRERECRTAVRPRDMQPNNSWHPYVAKVMYACMYVRVWDEQECHEDEKMRAERVDWGITKIDIFYTRGRRDPKGGAHTVDIEALALFFEVGGGAVLSASMAVRSHHFLP